MNVHVVRGMRHDVRGDPAQRLRTAFNLCDDAPFLVDLIHGVHSCAADVTLCVCTSLPTMSFDSDRFLVDQLVRPVANLYRVTPLAVGETPAGPPIAYVRQKKLKIKEDIRFY